MDEAGREDSSLVQGHLGVDQGIFRSTPHSKTLQSHRAERFLADELEAGAGKAPPPALPCHPSHGKKTNRLPNARRSQILPEVTFFSDYGGNPSKCTMGAASEVTYTLSQSRLQR